MLTLFSTSPTCCNLLHVKHLPRIRLNKWRSFISEDDCVLVFCSQAGVNSSCTLGPCLDSNAHSG